MSGTTNSNRSVSASLIKDTPILLAGSGAGSISFFAMLPAMAASAGLHIFIIAAFVLVLLIHPTKADGSGAEAGAVTIAVDDRNAGDRDNTEDPFDPTDENVGFNHEMPFHNPDTVRLGPIVDAPTNPLDPIGKPSPLDMPAPFAPPPPGFIGELGSALQGVVSGPNIGDLGMMLLQHPGDISGRSGSARELLLDKYGGNKESEAAVARGLFWLANHQSRDGCWAMDKFQDHLEIDDSGKETVRRCNCEGGVLHDNVAGTGLALLCFLGAGLTPENAKHQAHDYAKQIEHGLRWLKANQDLEGRFVDRARKQENSQHVMYDHAIATICMCEAASLHPKDWVRNSAQQAIHLLVQAQEPQSGGWDYGTSPQSGDTSVTGWCIMALQSGRMAGLKVSATAFERARHFFEIREVEMSDGLFYGYRNKALSDPRETLAAVGLLSRMYLGWQRENPRLIKGVDWLRRNAMPDPAGPTNMYFQYYATQVLHHAGGDVWKAWNPKMRDLLVSRQDLGKSPGRPHQAGSWSPNGDSWCSLGGRVMMTSLCILTLEVYYRHLPLYRSEMNEK
jgi:hypothetical protein